MSSARVLRERLQSGGLVVAPGAYDCVTAMLIARAGFDAVYMSGGCTAGMLGFPDYGLTTMTEMADNAGRIAEAVEIPVIADADTGFGSEINVIRTVREYERRGVSAIQIEDQTFPKRCGHLEGKEVVPVESFVSKIRAAAAGRRNPDTIIVARTDARSVTGFQDAVARMNAALEAGADVAFLEAPQTLEEVAQIPQMIKGPCLFNLVRGGRSPVPGMKDLADMGHRIVIVPGLLLAQVIGSCEEILEELRETQIHPVPRKDLPPKEMFRRVGMEAWDELRARFA